MDKSPVRRQLGVMATHRTPRLAARALILQDDRLLLVNAYPGGRSDLWCAPGGGARPGKSLHDNLIREVHEETGLTVTVGLPCLINEFHDPVTRLPSGRPVLPLHHRRRHPVRRLARPRTCRHRAALLQPR